MRSYFQASWVALVLTIAAHAQVLIATHKLRERFLTSLGALTNQRGVLKLYHTTHLLGP